ncbi:hypothetical protein BFF78_21845 [Streptomyces fodineus]|uniref:Bacterial Ig-like domain-containing protein n=1 Tax=Streptomyces fodineus TaxID=1904616 RepID=A0A1D7YCT1_9ACTN|nr:hypothetical protein BFF78_21845 [Streptomyces fodineus]
MKLTGRTKGLKISTALVLQHRMAGKWTNLNAATKAKKGSSYSLQAKLSKGTHVLRIAAVNGSGKVYSSTVTVKVS